MYMYVCVYILTFVFWLHAIYIYVTFMLHMLVYNVLSTETLVLDAHKTCVKKCRVA